MKSNPFTPRNVDERRQYILTTVKERVARVAELRRYATAKIESNEVIISAEDWNLIFKNYPYPDELEKYKTWILKNSSDQWYSVRYYISSIAREDRRAVNENEPRTRIKTLMREIERVKGSYSYYEDRYKDAMAEFERCKEAIKSRKEEIEALSKDYNLRARKPKKKNNKSPS